MTNVKMTLINSTTTDTYLKDMAQQRYDSCKNSLIMYPMKGFGISTHKGQLHEVEVDCASGLNGFFRSGLQLLHHLNQ